MATALRHCDSGTAAQLPALINSFHAALEVGCWKPDEYIGSTLGYSLHAVQWLGITVEVLHAASLAFQTPHILNNCSQYHVAYMLYFYAAGATVAGAARGDGGASGCAACNRRPGPPNPRAARPAPQR